MSTTTRLQHPRHDQHPLEPRDFRKDSIPPLCDLCKWKISADGYACWECKFYAHRVCVEAPPRIDLHSLGTDHPLTPIHCLQPTISNVCDLCYVSHDSLFRCHECDFNMDIRCAFSTQSDRGGTQWKTSVQINLPLHPHNLTSFYSRHEFIGDINCVICKARVEGDGYACLTGPCEFHIHKRCIQDLFGDEYDGNPDIICTSSTLLDQEGSEEKTPKWIALPMHQHLLTVFSTRYDFVKAIDCVICNASVAENRDGYACLHWQCEFLIHKRCIQDLYYTDGTKAPRVYHRHPLETFLGENRGSSKCANCGSDESREFIGCARCEVFIHRDCSKVPEIMQYPHNPEGHSRPSCEFFVDLECVSRFSLTVRKA